MKKLSLILVSASLLLSASNTFASADKTVYFLKGDAVTGSRLQTIEAHSNIPFNRAYDELSQKQKAQVKEKFKSLGINEVPPFPKYGLAAIYQPLIKANKAFGLNKTIKINATITRNGSVDKIEVLNSENAKFNDYIEHALSNAKFKPASCNGVSCEMNFPIEISFN